MRIRADPDPDPQHCKKGIKGNKKLTTISKIIMTKKLVTGFSVKIERKKTYIYDLCVCVCECFTKKLIKMVSVLFYLAFRDFFMYIQYSI